MHFSQRALSAVAAAIFAATLCSCSRHQADKQQVVDELTRIESLGEARLSLEEIEKRTVTAERNIAVAMTHLSDPELTGTVSDALKDYKSNRGAAIGYSKVGMAASASIHFLYASANMKFGKSYVTATISERKSLEKDLAKARDAFLEALSKVQEEQEAEKKAERESARKAAKQAKEANLTWAAQLAESSPTPKPATELDKINSARSAAGLKPLDR